MKTLEEKQLALLEDTVKYYSEDTNLRCVNKFDECYYSSKSVGKSNSKGCAIGRLVSPRLRIKLDEICGTVTEIFDFLPKKIRDYGVEFLQELQYLHDKSDYWCEDENGLTDWGKETLEEFKKGIANGVYKIQ